MASSDDTGASGSAKNYGIWKYFAYILCFYKHAYVHLYNFVL